MSHRRQNTPKRRRRNADHSDGESSRCRNHYQPPSLVEHGPLGALVRGASWKGVDSVGELNPDESYPG